MTNNRINKLCSVIRESRLRLCEVSLPFALPLFEMHFYAVKGLYRISTNGRGIFFDPDWFQKLDDYSVDFALAHQLMHIHLGHIERPLFYKGERFHLACDIVANAHLYELGWEQDEIPRIGKIYTRTFYPEVFGSCISSQQALKYIPFDPATLSPASKRKYFIDSDDWWGVHKECENGTLILSPDDNGDDVNDAFLIKSSGVRFSVKSESFDDEPIPQDKYREIKRHDWDSLAADKLEVLREVKKTMADRGQTEEFSERVWTKLDATELDWRKILNSDIVSSVKDYTFTRIDKRYDGYDFFMPDYNYIDEGGKTVILFADTSASMDKKMLDRVYTEIFTLVSQHGGSLTGELVFFDSIVYPAYSINDATILENVVPIGGGSTDYNCIFEYLKNKNGVSNVIIFTDGTADYPEIPIDPSVSVVWVFTASGRVAPFGKSVTLSN